MCKIYVTYHSVLYALFWALKAFIFCKFINHTHFKVMIAAYYLLFAKYSAEAIHVSTLWGCQCDETII